MPTPIRRNTSVHPATACTEISHRTSPGAWIRIRRRTRLAGTLLALAVAATTSAGCAMFGTGADAPDELSEDHLAGVTRYTVQRGDRLSEIAFEFTGATELWTEIAKWNAIEDPRSLAVGFVLEIPNRLILREGNGRPSEATLANARQTDKEAAERESAGRTAVAADGKPASVRRVAAATDNAPSAVVVSPVVANRNFELAPLEPGTADGSTDSAGVRFVKVVGSYYPKGVYEQPQTSSRLISRVSPGTVLRLERELGDWYKVTTDAGIGYLQDVDGSILDRDVRGALRTASSDSAG